MRTPVCLQNLVKKPGAWLALALRAGRGLSERGMTQCACSRRNNIGSRQATFSWLTCRHRMQAHRQQQQQQQQHKEAGSLGAGAFPLFTPSGRPPSLRPCRAAHRNQTLSAACSKGDRASAPDRQLSSGGTTAWLALRMVLQPFREPALARASDSDITKTCFTCGQ